MSDQTNAVRMSTKNISCKYFSITNYHILNLNSILSNRLPLETYIFYPPPPMNKYPTLRSAQLGFTLVIIRRFS